jgi:hypothetical protein
MKWDRIRDVAGLVSAVFLPLWWLNFLAFFIVGLFIGGNYFYGRAEGGEYFLALGANHDTHPLTQVSEQVYYYSLYHHWSIIALACIFGPAFLVWVIAGSVCRGRQRPREVRITTSGITLDGQPVSIDRVVEVLRAARTVDPESRPRFRVTNDYDARDAPPHAVAFQLALIDRNLLVEQEPPRGKDQGPAGPGAAADGGGM